jgi:hypothetical protein
METLATKFFFEQAVVHTIHELEKQFGERKTAPRGSGEKMQMNIDHTQS